MTREQEDQKWMLEAIEEAKKPSKLERFLSGLLSSETMKSSEEATICVRRGLIQPLMPKW